MIARRYDQCVALYRDGWRPREIATQTGVPVARIRAAVNRAVQRGELQTHAALRPRTLKQHAGAIGIKLGSIGGLSDELSEEQRIWLVDEAARLGCGTMQEYLAQVLRGLHAEHLRIRGQAGGEGGANTTGD